MKTITTARVLRDLDREKARLERDNEMLRRMNIALLDALVAPHGPAADGRGRLRAWIEEQLDELEAARAERDALKAEKWGQS